MGHCLDYQCIFIILCLFTFSSVLRRYWLGGRKEWWGNGMVIFLEQGADWHMAQVMPVQFTVSCFCKIQIGFTFLVLADLGSPRKRAVKHVCACPCTHARVGMCVCVCVLLCLSSGVKYCTQCVCVSLCLSVCLQILKTTSFTTLGH